MDHYNFIVYVVDPFLDIVDTTNLMMVSKKIKKYIKPVKIKLIKILNTTLNNFYDILLSNDVMSLQCSPYKILVEEPYLNKLFSNHVIDATFMEEINNCKHRIDGNCHICETILYTFITHKNGNKNFFQMSKIGSFISSVVMTLYH